MEAGHITQSEARAAVERLYAAFAQKDVNLLRQAVTSDWEYLPERQASRPVPTR